jgi:hypothetical protein
MSRKLNTVSAALAFAVIILAASSAFAQTIERRVGPAVRVPVELRPAAPASLGCCKCLGGTNTLDLRTVAPNRGSVNGGAAVFLSSIHPAWNINPGPASWVSTVPTGATGGVAAGIYEYRLDFVVPACTIEQRVTLTGNYGADNDVAAFLDDASGQPDASNPSFMSQCTGSWCFNSTRTPTLPTFSRAVGPGPHTLIIRVRNDGGPSGMFVNATLVGACRGE